MKRILVTAAGGSPATNFIRSLKASPEKYYYIGLDCNKFYINRSETDESYLVPKAADPNYIPVLQKIIKKTKPDFLYAQSDLEIAVISQHLDKLAVKTFLPSGQTIEICQSKYLSNKCWAEHGIKTPRTTLLKDERDLRSAFAEYGPTLWLRAINSPGGGKGSFKAEYYSIAKEWIDYNKGWGEFTASECLTDKTVTWSSIWKNGKLIVSQGRLRHFWEFGNRAPSGVTGITGAGSTYTSKLLDKIAEKSVRAIDQKPDGIFCVDFTYDDAGTPNPTEINIGRFFTTISFFTEAGLNMPHIYLKTAFDEPVNIEKVYGPLENGLCWIRGMDFLPKLCKISDIENYELGLKKMLENED